MNIPTKETEKYSKMNSIAIGKVLGDVYKIFYLLMILMWFCYGLFCFLCVGGNNFDGEDSLAFWICEMHLNSFSNLSLKY